MRRGHLVLKHDVTAGILVLALVLAAAGATGLAWRRGYGRMRAPGGAHAVSAAAAAGPGAGSLRPAVSSADLGAALGARATLVQFSTAFCAPCRATRQVLTEVAGMTDGVAHIEIDAESRLDLVRRFDIRRTPTVLVLGPDGRITKRASGPPCKADVIAAVGEVG
jgi:thiol-disulfide isomerase/thioredoxin